MTAPGTDRPAGAAAPMTPERWRAVDVILQAALSCAPGERERLIAEACGDDAELRREVTSLLDAHDRAGADFLEQPAAEALGMVGGAPGARPPLAQRLATALAGRYAIEREVAHGGTATVYLARDLRHDRRVAIKVLREDLAAAVGAERFLREIRVTASLQHPHILPLFDSGGAGYPPEAGGWLLWYAMPFVEGETLRSRLAREGRLPVDAAVALAREVADALDYAHRRGVVHRDVKPENVLLEDGHALVADFGIALALEHAGGERLTRTGLTIGTPQYMAPEQAAGDRGVDARTDVYALGAVLHEMLAGAPPFAAPSPQEAVRRMLHEPPPALSASRADVPPFLDAAVRRALAKRPDDRFASAADFAAAVLAPPQGAAPAPAAPAPAPREPARTSAPSPRMVPARAAIYAAAATLVLGLAGGWAIARFPLDEPQAATDTPKPAAPPALAIAPGAPAATGDTSLVVVDRGGRVQRAITADSAWTPRLSPDGRRMAYGAFGVGRSTSDLWVTDLESGATLRITDDGADANDPQWSPDGTRLAYSAAAPDGKDIMVRELPAGAGRVLASRGGTQFASDWRRDGSALLVTERVEGGNGLDILVQPADGTPARRYAAGEGDQTAARFSPDGRWVAYTSDESGRPEVYLDSYPRPGRRVMLSSGGGAHPVWRGDGRELYYWRSGALTAVRLGAPAGDAPPAVRERLVLFRMPYRGGVNTMYDASSDGQRFVVARSPRPSR